MELGASIKEAAFAKGRHVDLDLAVDEMASKGFNFVQNHRFLLKPGDNTLIGNIYKWDTKIF
ncbi:MAG: hypothetical protein J7599_24210 [Niabella sp.]|nr:hypothetical protein [Niabella sp.]